MFQGRMTNHEFLKCRLKYKLITVKTNEKNFAHLHFGLC